MDTKYVVYHNLKHDTEDVIMFSCLLKHCQVAKHLPGEAISAGFVSIYTESDRSYEVTLYVDCYGESDSLQLKSRSGVDSQLIRDHLLET